MYKALFVLLSAAIAQVQCASHPSRHMFLQVEPSAAQKNPIQTGTFKQLLDHTDPSKGTFDQAFFWDAQYYKGPGSPVIMFAPQEANATLYTGLLTNQSVTGVLAQKIGAATVLMEHRYWGNSSPYSKLTTENMAYLTLDQAIADCNYFANNVVLPFAKGHPSNAKDVAWTLIGGSYSGALTAWIAAKAPGTFWAYLASSGVVEAISDFWQYYKQIELGMPQNCSKDVNLVIDHMDNVFEHGTASQITELKTMFGLESVSHSSDVMAALTLGPSSWQNPAFFVSNAPFYEWCDYVENSYNVPASKVAGPNGVGLTKALAGYAAWFKDVLLPGFCASSYGYFKGNYSTECFDTYNANNPIFTDTSLSNTADRQWNWFLCNQPFGWWQVGLPEGQSTLVSRLVNVDYYTRQCGLFFPTGPGGQTYGIAKGATEGQVNAYTGGWFIDNTTRLMYTNGQYDPWRDATVSSLYRPGGPLASTEQVPVNVVPDGNHCSDLVIANGERNAGVLAIQEKEYAQLEQWISEFGSPPGYGNNTTA